MDAYRQRRQAGRQFRRQDESQMAGRSSVERDFMENFVHPGVRLIYGLADPRSPYVYDFETPTKQAMEKTPFFIDTYNNAVIEVVAKNLDHNKRLIAQLGNANAAESAEIVRNLIIPENLEQMASEIRPKLDWHSYLDVGKDNRKFNMAEIYREVADKFGQHFYYQISPDGEPTLLWKRGSKLGLEMAARKKAKIHFVLDGLDIAAAASKQGKVFNRYWNMRTGEGITASELRYAYRNRDRLQGQIFFYKDKKTVRPPWESEPELWKAAATRQTTSKPERRQESESELQPEPQQEVLPELQAKRQPAEEPVSASVQEPAMQSTFPPARKAKRVEDRKTRAWRWLKKRWRNLKSRLLDR